MVATRFIEHLLEGDHASRPAANAVPEGTLYACSDHSLIYQSDTSAWATWATLGTPTPGLDAIIAASSGEDVADALAGAAAPDNVNVFATMADVGGSTDLDAIITASAGQDIADALAGAAVPDAANVFATMADVVGGTLATVPTMVQGVGTAGLTAQNPTLTIASAASGHTLILGVDLLNRASTSVTCTNVTWTKVAGPTTSAGGARYETWIGVCTGASGTTITVNTGSSAAASLVCIEIVESVTVSAGTPYDADYGVNGTYGFPLKGLSAPTAGKLVVAFAGLDNTTTGTIMLAHQPMVGYSRNATGTGCCIMAGYTNGSDVTCIMSGGTGTVGHVQIVTVN